MFFRFAGVALLFTASIALHAANIINTTGSNSFGFNGQLAFVTAWDQTVPYSGVTITMPLEDNSAGGPIGGVEGTVYLMNQIGPGTTAANQVVAPVNVSGLTAAFTNVTLFSGLTLFPGHYYIVLVPTNASPMSMSPDGTNVGAVVTTGTSVTTLGVGVPAALAAYPPASTVTLNPPGNLYLNVTGTQLPLATPVPSSLLLTLAGLVAVGLWFAKRKFAAV
ncbi:MAG: PEP-CTERM sorting domain-containing protein [Bryobacteraceae bacterium]